MGCHFLLQFNLLANCIFQLPFTFRSQRPIGLSLITQLVSTKAKSTLPLPKLQFTIEGKSESEVAQSCPTLSDPMDCSLPGSSIHGIFQARVLEWGAIAFSQETLVWCNLVLRLPCIVSLLNIPLSQKVFSHIFTCPLDSGSEGTLRGIPSPTSLTAF